MEYSIQLIPASSGPTWPFHANECIFAVITRSERNLSILCLVDCAVDQKTDVEGFRRRTISGPIPPDLERRASITVGSTPLINRRLVATGFELTRSQKKKSTVFISSTVVSAFCIHKRPRLPDFRPAVKESCSSLLAARKASRNGLGRRDYCEEHGEDERRLIADRYAGTCGSSRKKASGCLEAAEINQRGASASTFTLADRQGERKVRAQPNGTAFAPNKV